MHTHPEGFRDKITGGEGRLGSAASDHLVGIVGED